MRPHTLATLLWALLLTVLASPSTAHAAPARMAVMDLTKGAGSQEYDGLGMALSGMLVSDLVQVEQLALVERQRLDDVVGELKLSEGEFIDPKTAQKLGRGLGADLILVGSYSVVGETFVLDGRIVDVASGEVKGAGSSTGTIDDFVAVEKDLIDQLIQALNIQLGASVKRKLMLQAQTESFKALSAYGEGLKRKKQGRADDAKAAFQRATQLDPEFAAAKAALTEMHSKVQAHEEALEDWKSKLKADAHRTVLEAFPDESKRPKRFVHDYKSLSELTLRLIALEQAGLHCQRAKEMRAFLDRMEWKLDAPLVSAEVYRATQEAVLRAQYEGTYAMVAPGEREKIISQLINAQMPRPDPKADAEFRAQVETQSERLPPDARKEFIARVLQQRRTSTHLEENPNFHQMVLIHLLNAVQAQESAGVLESYQKTLAPSAASAHPTFQHLYVYMQTQSLWGSGLTGFALGTITGMGLHGNLKASLKACHRRADYLAALEDFAGQVTKSGADDNYVGTVTIGLTLEMELTELLAEAHGATPALQKRMDAMLAKHPIGTPQHAQVLAHAKKITEIAQKQGAAQRIRSDLSKEEILRILAAATDKDSGVIRKDKEVCKHLAPGLKMLGSSLKMTMKSYQQMPAATQDQMMKIQFDASMPMLAATKDLGCLTDHPSRFKDEGALRAFLEKTIANLRPAPGAPDMCEMMTIHLDQLETFDLNHPMLLSAALQSLYSQAQQGCIEL